MTQSILSADFAATEKFGVQLGSRLRGGEVIELISDLGGGKTTLTRGIAHGAGSDDVVGSPTFMLSKVYKTSKFAIYHFDFYRLPEPGIMEYELSELVGDPAVVLIIEWGSVLAHILPKERLTVNIHKTGDDSRKLVCEYSNSLAYLFP